MESFGVRSLRTLKPHWGKGLDSSLRPFGLHAREAGSHRPCPLCSSPPASLLVPSSGVQRDMQALLPGEEWGKGRRSEDPYPPCSLQQNRLCSALFYACAVCYHVKSIWRKGLLSGHTGTHSHTRDLRNTGEILCQQLVF